jgi:hypothetical protein
MDILAGDSRTLKLSILADVDDLNKKLKAATGDVEGFGGKMANVGKKIGVALAAAAAAAGAMAIKIGVDAVKAASNLSETQSKVAVIFGESSVAIEKFAATAATKLGQSKQQALDAAATFATFGKSAGLAGDDLVGFSTELTTLSADLASFYNTSPEEAITAIGAALRGESEPIRKYGILLNDAALKQEAMNMGIYNGTGALTAQQKVLAAQAVIMKQTTDAQGDFERTSGGLANQQRILAAQFENVKTTIGTALLPVVLELVSAFNRNVLPAIVKVGDAIGQGGLTGAISFIKDLIQKFFTPVLAGLKGAWDSIRDALVRNSDSFEKLSSFIKNVVAPVIGTTLRVALEVVGTVFGKIIDIIGGAIDKISAFVESVKNMVNAVISAYNRLPTPDIALVGGGGSSGGSFTSGGAPGAIAGGGNAGILAAVQGLATVTSSMSGLTGGAATGAGASAANKKALAKLEADANMLQGLVDQLMGKQYNVGTGNYGGLAGAGQAGGGGGVNITVNGAIDSESTARQIVEILNDSAARGTLGAAGFSR